jgi:prevent-host-death family protein
MSHVGTDIDSLTNFKRQTAAYVKQLRKSGAPVVLTINGKAEVVVQDAAAYRRLVDRAAQAEREETVVALREALKDVEAGRTKPARAALRRLARKHGIPKRDA